MSGDGGSVEVPRSQADVRRLLETLGLRPHKRFGQNFLADVAILDRIVACSGAGPQAVVLEVGAGLGTLTARLLETGAVIVAVEIDHGLARHLRATFGGERRLTLVEGDVLGVRGELAPEVVGAVAGRLAEAPGARLHVAANLPYGISSPFLGSLMGKPGPPRRAAILLQSEFADVLAAKPSTDSYGALTAWAQTFFDVRREFDVPRRAFHPVPDVTSTVVALTPRAEPGVNPAELREFLRVLFGARRKAIGTTLRGPCGSAERARAVLERAGIDPRTRAETIEPRSIVALHALVKSAVAGG